MAPASADAAGALDESPEAREARISERLAQRSVSLMVREFERAPVPVMCADGFIAYLATTQTATVWPWLWLAIGTGLQLYRYSLARAIKRNPPASANDAIRSLMRMFASIGLARATILPIFFIHPPVTDAAFLVTMVFTGLAAGGVASAAGTVRALLAWGVPSFATLIAGWLWTGGVAGVAVATLLALLFAILLAYVRDQRLVIAELVRLVDDRETLSQSLERERDRAESASEGKTRFFAAASHDLRQPLHALSINATTLGLLSRRLDHPMLRDVSRGIDSALSQSRSLLDGLLDISRLDAHAVEARMTPLELGGLLREICDEFQAMAHANSLDLRLHMIDEETWCNSDPEHLRRVVNNVVSNALKFTRQGSVTISVSTLLDRVLVRFTDTGAGVPADEWEKVFEEFYQCGNPSRDRSQGLGLGLAIVKRTCQLLDIDLKFSSFVGVGTTVELRIPIALPLPRLEGLPAHAAEDDEEANVSLSALVIDDESQVVEAVERYLTALGWRVRSGATGQDGEDALDDGFCPDVLVVDYRLRNETGLDVISRLRARLPELPAVIITGDTAPNRLRELTTQASAVLHKPVDGAHLVAALVQAVNASAATALAK